MISIVMKKLEKIAFPWLFGYFFIFFRRCFKNLKNRMYFKKYDLHSSSSIGFNTILSGDGRIITGKNVVIGRHGAINTSEGRTVKIGDNVTMSHYVNIYTSNRISNQDFSIYPHKTQSGDVIIKDNCFIGFGVFVKEGVTMGKNSVIGAHSVVTKDIPDYCVAVGCPAKVVKELNLLEARS